MNLERNYPMEKQNNNKGIKVWFGKNIVSVLYFIFSICIEMITVMVVEGSPFISNPFIELGFLIFITAVSLLIRKNMVRAILLSFMLVVQAVADLAFVVIYDMTGQYFDYGMLNLRNDAFGILESIPMNFVVFYTAVFFCIFFVIFALRFLANVKINEYTKKQKIGYIAAVFAGIIMFVAAIYYNNSKNVDKYEKLLYNEQTGNYSSYGIIGNTINEFAKGLIFDDTVEISDKKIEEFIYAEVSEPTEKFGVCKDKNLVVILVESYEWFSMINSDEYPNQLDLTEEEIEYLLPNLCKFYGESVVMNNFHSKEKTDISETISILGSYPTDKYIAYDFPENKMPHTLPNTLKILSDNNMENNSFHNGFASFYNRSTSHKSFGFNKLTDSYDMYDMSDELVKSGVEEEATMYDYMNEGQRNLDSQMVYTCKDVMFPKDERFFTYITTITMHGIYYERENLAEHREKLLEVYKPKDENDVNEQYLVNYLTTVMEFDKALGIMLDDLEKKGILEDTTIVLFGDHNAYYHQLSSYVKDIYDYDTKNYYTDLYKVPLMIYDADLEHEVIDKFMCTSDIVPTLFDLFGINYYTNMYYGTSAFNDEESVLYSRAYGFFAGEGVVARSLNSILYKAPSVTDEYIEYFNEQTEELVREIKYCDQIFYKDYFDNDENYETYLKKIKEIN